MRVGWSIACDMSLLVVVFFVCAMSTRVSQPSKVCHLTYRNLYAIVRLLSCVQMLVASRDVCHRIICVGSRHCNLPA